MLELYHHGTSACAAKVRLALEEKRLPWTGHYVDLLKGEQFDARFLRIHPKAVDEELHPACSTLTYVVSHRHTILRNGAGTFNDFLKQGAGEGTAARERKWRWIQEGLKAPGAGDQIRLYDGYLRKMEDALQSSLWLVGERFTMADVALAPYVNRLAALSMHGMWDNGRYPRVAEWFERLRARPTFKPALVDWVPEELRKEMEENGRKSWPEVRQLLAGESG